MAEPDPRASLPQVEILLSRPELAPGIAKISRSLAAAIVARTLEDFRRELAKPGAPDAASVPGVALKKCLEAVAQAERRTLRKVLNGTGVVLHTNLGRSPIPRTAWKSAPAG